jgi:type I restriction enzyme R subunit
VPDTPEQKARLEIDADLVTAGWLVQDRDELDLTAGRGVAVREFSMKQGFGVADYLLYVNRKAIGAVRIILRPASHYIQCKKSTKNL